MLYAQVEFLDMYRGRDVPSLFGGGRDRRYIGAFIENVGQELGRRNVSLHFNRLTWFVSTILQVDWLDLKPR